MCATSMIMDHHQQMWPTPNFVPPMQYQQYQELLRKAQAYDLLMKQPECPDPAKEAWHKALEAFMLEKYGMQPVSTADPQA